MSKAKCQISEWLHVNMGILSTILAHVMIIGVLLLQSDVIFTFMRVPLT